MNPAYNLMQPPGEKTNKYKLRLFNSTFQIIARWGSVALVLILTSSPLFSAVDIKSQDDLQVDGQVTDARGEVLPGVNILVEGTVTGTVTDLDGNYSINAPRGSYFGFLFYRVRHPKNPG